MTFGLETTLLCAVLRIDLPGHNIRISQAGEVEFDGDIYRPIDPVFGSIVSYDTFEEGLDNQSPLYELVFGLQDSAAAVAFSQPSSQGAFASITALGLERSTNAIVEQEEIFVGRVNSTEVAIDSAGYTMPTELSTEADRLLNTDKGNRLNRSFHRAAFPGESGLDLMTGTDTAEPWGGKDRQRMNSGTSQTNFGGRARQTNEGRTYYV